jgi:hypothetical protein
MKDFLKRFMALTVSEKVIALAMPSLVIMVLLLLAASLCGGIMVDKQIAINCAEIQGFSEVEVLEKDWFAIPMRGGGNSDSARFKMRGINPSGKEVEFYVFAGWLFKGATIRTF